MVLNNVESKSVKDVRDGLFDVKIFSKLPQDALKSETIINCQLTLPNTNYLRKRETVYYGNWIIALATTKLETKTIYIDFWENNDHFLIVFQYFLCQTEQPPTSAENDFDEEADLVLSLETGLLSKNSNGELFLKRFLKSLLF